MGRDEHSAPTPLTLVEAVWRRLSRCGGTRPSVRICRRVISNLWLKSSFRGKHSTSSSWSVRTELYKKSDFLHSCWKSFLYMPTENPYKSGGMRSVASAAPYLLRECHSPWASYIHPPWSRNQGSNLQCPAIRRFTSSSSSLFLN